SDVDALATSLVGTGFSYATARRERQGAVVARVLPRARDVRRFGAAALDLCWVACGRLDAFYEKGLERWDLEAGALIARESVAAGAGRLDIDLSDIDAFDDAGAAALLACRDAAVAVDGGLHYRTCSGGPGQEALLHAYVDEG